ncbi:MAG: AAA family ATPase [Anaerolineae bacterium]|nr:AAA family ATPase [Anaerolineae bacterium]
MFYGPPGTGKTYLAQRLGRFLAGRGDGFIDLVQFHPAYAYEDFMQGIRPLSQPDGSLSYDTVPGRFLEFCAEAERRQGICVLIIDEINRFIALQPDYDLLRRYHEEEETGSAVEELIAMLTELNARIGDPHYALGITYFLRHDLAGQLAHIWRTEVEP